MNDLIEHIEKLHTTERGIERIKRNMQMETDDIVQWCRAKILHRDAEMNRVGKNWYVAVDSCILTVNAHSYTIITVHKAKKQSHNS